MRQSENLANVIGAFGSSRVGICAVLAPILQCFLGVCKAIVAAPREANCRSYSFEHIHDVSARGS